MSFNNRLIVFLGVLLCAGLLFYLYAEATLEVSVADTGALWRLFGFSCLLGLISAYVCLREGEVDLRVVFGHLVLVPAFFGVGYSSRDNFLFETGIVYLSYALAYVLALYCALLMWFLSKRVAKMNNYRYPRDY